MKLQKQSVFIISIAKLKNLIFKKLNILTLHNLYRMNLSLFLYKFINGKLPVVFENFFVTNNIHHNYSTRNASNFRIPLCRTEIRKRTVRFAAIPVYNYLFNFVEFSIKNISIQEMCEGRYYKTYYFITYYAVHML